MRTEADVAKDAYFDALDRMLAACEIKAKATADYRAEWIKVPRDAATVAKCRSNRGNARLAAGRAVKNALRKRTAWYAALEALARKRRKVSTPRKQKAGPSVFTPMRVMPGAESFDNIFTEG